jgi:hypothetical protein
MLTVQYITKITGNNPKDNKHLESVKYAESKCQLTVRCKICCGMKTQIEYLNA